MIDTDRLLDEIASGGSAFALVDAARDASIYPALLRADCPWLSLYRGDAAVRLAAVAPYLVELRPEAKTTRWLLESGWTKSWGVFLNAGVTAEGLRGHFRQLLMVQLPNGKHVYFRFYDPRVLRVYLPTCTPEELESVFGPVERFVMESERGAGALDFRREDGGLAVAERAC